MVGGGWIGLELAARGECRWDGGDRAGDGDRCRSAGARRDRSPLPGRPPYTPRRRHPTGSPSRRSRRRGRPTGVVTSTACCPPTSWSSRSARPPPRHSPRQPASRSPSPGPAAGSSSTSACVPPTRTSGRRVTSPTPLHTQLGPLRVEHWDNAIRQGKAVARSILGQDVAYDWQPYFYTDQFDFGMEYVGRGSATDDVEIRGSLESGEFIAYWLTATRDRRHERQHLGRQRQAPRDGRHQRGPRPAHRSSLTLGAGRGGRSATVTRPLCPHVAVGGGLGPLFTSDVVGAVVGCDAVPRAVPGLHAAGGARWGCGRVRRGRRHAVAPPVAGFGAG